MLRARVAAGGGCSTLNVEAGTRTVHTHPSEAAARTFLSEAVVPAACSSRAGSRGWLSRAAARPASRATSFRRKAKMSTSASRNTSWQTGSASCTSRGRGAGRAVAGSIWACGAGAMQCQCPLGCSLGAHCASSSTSPKRVRWCCHQETRALCAGRAPISSAAPLSGSSTAHRACAAEHLKEGRPGRILLRKDSSPLTQALHRRGCGGGDR